MTAPLAPCGPNWEVECPAADLMILFLERNRLSAAQLSSFSHEALHCCTIIDHQGFSGGTKDLKTPAHLAAWRTRRPKSLATTACVACAWTSPRERLRPARLLRPPSPCRARPDPRVLRRHGVEGDIGSALRHTSARLCIPAYEYTSALHNFPYWRAKRYVD